MRRTGEILTRWRPGTKGFQDEEAAYAGADRLCLPAGGGGTAIGEILRRLGVSEATFCRWKKKYGGLGAAEMRRPKQLQVDNSPEFVSKDLNLWAYFAKVKLDFSRPGKPTDDALIEAFHARLRQECLNEHWFLSLEDAQEKVDAWRRDYNEQRPHSSLGNVRPAQFAERRDPLASAAPRPPVHAAAPEHGP